MIYEYKSILLSYDDEDLSSGETEELNEWFDEGWEYVDKITQPVSTSNYTKRGAIIIIIRTPKDLLP